MSFGHLTARMSGHRDTRAGQRKPAKKDDDDAVTESAVRRQAAGGGTFQEALSRRCTVQSFLPGPGFSSPSPHFFRLRLRLRFPFFLVPEIRTRWLDGQLQVLYML